MPPDDSIWKLPGAEMGDRSPADYPRDGERIPVARGGLACGDSIADRFEIRKLIGRGGMGAVYEAFDQVRGEPVAVKVLVPGLLEDPEAVRQFASEAALAKRLSHPNIVTVYDYHAAEGSYAIVMELLEGRTLREEIRARQEDGEPFSLHDVERIIGALCDALSYAHEFTVHRDLKPENVWIGPGGELKLMDFGLAKIVPRQAEALSLQILSQVRLGSPYYMAPEQLFDAERATGAADQFSVGVIAYELLTGELPVGLAKPLREMRPDLAYELTEVVDRALASDPGDRYPSIAEFREAFVRGCEARPSLRQRIETRPLLRRTLKVAAVVAVVATLGAFTMTIVQRRAEAIETATRQAQDDLLAARTELPRIKRLIAAGHRVQIESKAALERVVAEAAAAEGAEEARRSEGSLPERFRPPPDVPTALARELDVAKAERDAAIAEAAWEALAPRLSESGVPFAVEAAFAEMENALRARDFATFARQRDAFQETVARESAAVAGIRSWAVSSAALRALAQGRDAWPESESSETPEHSIEWEAALHVVNDWDRALEDSRHAESMRRAPLAARFAELAGQYETATADWAARFPGKLGPPPIEFLGHPAAKAEAARQWEELDRFDRAIPLIEEAGNIVSGWSREVASLHDRCADSWAEAQEKGIAFENVLGMRFVRIKNEYWSVWETRVMDFAHIAARDPGAVSRAGSFWKHPGHAQGPTHPVVGIPPEVAQTFANWLRVGIRGEVTDSVEHTLPGWDHYEAMLGREAEWQSAAIKRAVCPSIRELTDPMWLRGYADTTVDAARFIRPVASGPPAAQGLYDLFGNAWEWTGSPRVIDKSTLDDKHPLYSLYGGSFFGDSSFHGFTPPDDETIFVARNDAISFRVIFGAHKLVPPLEAADRQAR